MPRATLSTKGQVVVPKNIRDELGLHPGDQLDFELQENGHILVRPATVDIRSLEGILHRPGQKALSVEEMNEIIRQRGAGRR